MSSPNQMTFRSLTSSGDWTWGQGVQNYSTGEAAIEVNIKTALQMFQGEAFWNTTFGVAWLSLLSSYGATQTTLNIVLQTRSLIVQCFGVTNIVSVQPIFNSITRRLNLTYAIDTIYRTNVLGQLVNTLT